MNEPTDDFAILPPPERTEPCKLYLISVQDVGGAFPERLKAALGAGPVAAFQLRVKDVDEVLKEALATPVEAIEWSEADELAAIPAPELAPGPDEVSIRH